MTLRPGMDRSLKLDLARLSTSAAQVLGPAITRDCADIRVWKAIEAALQDPSLAQPARERIADMADAFPLDPNDARTVTLRFRVSADEDDRIRSLANESGQTLSDFLRTRALLPVVGSGPNEGP